MRFYTVVQTEGNACCSVYVGYYLELVVWGRGCVLELAFELPFAAVLLEDLECEWACKWAV